MRFYLRIVKPALGFLTDPEIERLSLAPGLTLALAYDEVEDRAEMYSEGVKLSLYEGGLGTPDKEQYHGTLPGRSLSLTVIGPPRWIGRTVPKELKQ